MFFCIFVFHIKISVFLKYFAFLKEAVKNFLQPPRNFIRKMGFFYSLIS